MSEIFSINFLHKFVFIDCDVYGRKCPLIKITDKQNGLFFYWTLENFKTKLELMKQVQSSPEKEISEEKDDIFEEDSKEDSPKQDPFYGIAPWFHQLGKALTYISNILEEIPLVVKVPIVNENGEIQGESVYILSFLINS